MITGQSAQRAAEGFSEIRSDGWHPTGDQDDVPYAPIPVTVSVLEEAFTLEMEGREPVTVKAGRAIVMPPQVKMTG